MKNTLNKIFNLKNGEKYIIELNDIPKYIKDKKKNTYINIFLYIFFVLSAIGWFITGLCLLSFFEAEDSIYSNIIILFHISISALALIFMSIINNMSFNEKTNLYINYFKDDFNNIDFSEPISIDENYNILYFNKNKELHIFQIVYDNILYVAYNNEIKLEGKYIDKKNYNITLYVPIEKSFDYINNFKKNEV